jgi:4a-hydroxytetrahydrobiopterin dehydratase
MTSDLAGLECVPCKGGIPPMQGNELASWAKRLGGDWQVVDGHHLAKDFRFKDFRQALAFTNQVGELAEAVNHHPDLGLSWGRVQVTVWTHKINGLSETDFVFAARVDALRSSPGN